MYVYIYIKIYIYIYINSGSPLGPAETSWTVSCTTCSLSSRMRVVYILRERGSHHSAGKLHTRRLHPWGPGTTLCRTSSRTDSHCRWWTGHLLPGCTDGGHNLTATELVWNILQGNVTDLDFISGPIVWGELLPTRSSSNGGRKLTGTADPPRYSDSPQKWPSLKVAFLNRSTMSRHHAREQEGVGLLGTFPLIGGNLWGCLP